MKSFNKYHISIGSNIGDRLQNLQDAIDLIHLEISIVTSISPIYQTKAVGFEGDDFYNICISFFSNDDPNNLLQTLLIVFLYYSFFVDYHLILLRSYLLPFIIVP